jgi:hypothetical protein
MEIKDRLLAARGARRRTFDSRTSNPFPVGARFFRWLLHGGIEAAIWRR